MSRCAVLGTGVVGEALASKLVELGHEVAMGSRSASNSRATAWADTAGDRGRNGTFADAAAFGEMLLNCTAGTASLEALAAALAGNLSGKILIDVANPLDFSKGFPPTLSVCNGDSLGEQIQRTFPDARVVKTFNTMNHAVMVDPGAVPGDHTVMMCGNDDAAKREVRHLIESFGWRHDSIMDLGDITACRGMEMYLPLWLRFLQTIGQRPFNIRVVA